MPSANEEIKSLISAGGSATGGNVVSFQTGKGKNPPTEKFSWTLDEDRDGPLDEVDFRLRTSEILDALAGIDPNEKPNCFRVAAALKHMFKRKPKTGKKLLTAWLELSGAEDAAGLGEWYWQKVKDGHEHPASWRSLLNKAKQLEPEDRAEAAERRDSNEFMQLELDLPDRLTCRVIGRGYIEFPAVSGKGAINTTNMTNAFALFEHYGARLRFNEFDRKPYVNGRKLDNEEIGRWTEAAHVHGFNAASKTIRSAIYIQARKAKYHPVREKLLACANKWDGKPRLVRFAVDYLNAEDTELHSAIGVLMFVSAVRRVFKPGYKCDQLFILQGAQDKGKSLVLRIMALRDEWFTDCLNVGDTPKIVLEQMGGKWIVECAELDGMSRREVERVKAFVSRQEEKARKAFQEEEDEERRQFVLTGTTNKNKYLLDDTGNRRFPSIRCGQKINHKALRRDIEQLYGEAVAMEREYGWLELPKHLKAEARKQAENRRLISPVEDKARSIFSSFDYGKVTVDDVYEVIGLNQPVAQAHKETIGRTARELGWKLSQRRRQGIRAWTYVKGAEDQLAGENSWLKVCGRGTGDDPYHLASAELIELDTEMGEWLGDDDGPEE